MLLNFSWLVPEQLAGAGQPGSGGAWAGPQVEALVADLERLRRDRIGAIVSLTEGALDTDVVDSFGIRYLHLPVGDMMAPSFEEMDRFLLFARGCSKDQLPLLVHCRAGMGRTGTMLAVYLVGQEMMQPSEAVAQVRRVRPGSIETADQEAAVHLFAQHHDQKAVHQG